MNNISYSEHMKQSFLIFCVITVFCGLLSGCKTVREIPYLQNSAEYRNDDNSHLYDMTIKPKDELFIFVQSSNGEAAAVFNTYEGVPYDTRNPRLFGGRTLHTYKVENDGNINFPLVGAIHVAGLTIDQANDHIKGKIAKYFTNDIDYSVHTYITNYDVTVMGEVKRPNTFNIANNKVNVLEALAMAGDMTIYGLRTNVKLLRELPNGEYEIHQLDLTDANLLNSPYYYMHQRDILYVEPNSVQAQNAKVSETTRLWVRGASIVISLGSLLYRVLE